MAKLTLDEYLKDKSKAGVALFEEFKALVESCAADVFERSNSLADSTVRQG